MTEGVRVATAGTGYFSQFHYNAWTRMRDEGLVDFVALCNRSAGPAGDFAHRFGVPGVYSDVSTMLNHVEVDVLDVITPPTTAIYLLTLSDSTSNGMGIHIVYPIWQCIL